MSRRTVIVMVGAMLLASPHLAPAQARPFDAPAKATAYDPLDENFTWTVTGGRLFNDAAGPGFSGNADFWGRPDGFVQGYFDFSVPDPSPDRPTTKGFGTLTFTWLWGFNQEEFRITAVKVAAPSRVIDPNDPLLGGFFGAGSLELFGVKKGREPGVHGNSFQMDLFLSPESSAESCFSEAPCQKFAGDMIFHWYELSEGWCWPLPDCPGDRKET